MLADQGFFISSFEKVLDSHVMDTYRVITDTVLYPELGSSLFGTSALGAHDKTRTKRSTWYNF